MKRIPWEPLFMVVLFWYPLRHIYWGIDLWDTGYNYGNFAYTGLEYIDSMWFFSTYLANVAGHLITMLPGASVLVGMNLYTGLLISFLAVAGYWFCNRKLGIESVIAFAGEMLAISLCWCPTALLYNYLTYILFLTCVILLYIGLTEERMRCLVVAGICLGVNVLVRFSNLTEAAMIAAVWVYAFMAAHKRHEKGFKTAVRYTFYCVIGYLGALAVLLGYIHVRYGLDSYIEGVGRLFAMTEEAVDYKPTSMLSGLIDPYVENLYWAGRIAIITLMGTVGFMILELIGHLCGLIGKEKFAKNVLRNISRAGACALAVLMLAWLYVRGFCSLEFYSYGSMLRPGILFLMLAMIIAVIRILHPKSHINEKLISGMVILVVILTSLGSNNNVYPSLNNLFVVGPYTLWQCCRFISQAGDGKSGIRGIVFSAFPLKAVLTAFLAMFFYQIGSFGAGFVFAESTGVQNVTNVIENNEVLKGIRMSPERAEWMSGISDYVAEQGLTGQEVMLYGGIPALSYYLQMPPAFNPWSDLRSYQYGVMERDMQKLTEDIESGISSCPVIILERKCGLYLEGGTDRLIESGISQSEAERIENDRKLKLMGEFMDELNYDLTYSGDKFMLYRVGN